MPEGNVSYEDSKNALSKQSSLEKRSSEHGSG
jgi:hypothetical protein